MLFGYFYLYQFTGGVAHNYEKNLMLNFSFNLFLFFFTFLLIKLNILLLNEETLILVCFILFCSLSVSKLGPQVSAYFQGQLLAIHNTFTSSNKQFLELVVKNKKQLSPTVV